jgi:hypothetical protein
MKKSALCVLLALVFFTQGCCSIFTRDPQTITITSNPEGAEIKMGPYTGITPLQVTLPRGKDYVIKGIYGQQTKTVNLTKTIENIYWLNLFPPFAGLVIDMATGKMFTYEPLNYDIDFYK